MVVAEVPLWAMHKKAGDASWVDGVGGASAAVGASGGGSAPPSGEENALLLSNASRAVRAAELWRTGTKGPVYALDFLPSTASGVADGGGSVVFATGGGDGAVRVWNASALFRASDRRGSGGAAVQRARIDPTAAGGCVVSSEAESGNDGDDSSGSNDEHCGEEESDNDGSNHRRSYRNQSNRPSDRSDGGSASGSSSSSSDPRQAEVHDLTAVVRRKKGDGHPAATVDAATPPRGRTGDGTAAENGAPAASPGRSPRRKHHNNHHRRLITTLTGHSGHSVLAVRFSTHGQYIATGGDDGMVMVYAVPSGLSHQNDDNGVANDNDNNNGTFASAASYPGAYWPRKHICSGHNLDVVDLAWAPDDSVLVSCSLDSQHPVCVWNVRSPSSSTSSLRLAPYRVLGAREHSSTVRGVTFDPAGSYLATSGDDPAVCVWRAHDDWGLEARITDVFGATSSVAAAFAAPTFVRRLSWSTDGGYVCCTNAVVKHRHVAATVNRQGWESAASATNSAAKGSSNAAAANLVGHKQPVVVCRHAPRLLRAGDEESEGNHPTRSGTPPPYATLLALGDKQGFVTVWTTKQTRPVFKLQCASRTTVTDLAWGSTPHSPNLPILLVSQLDGAITALQFQHGELPPFLTAHQQSRVFQLKYGMDAGAVGGIPLLLGRNQPQTSFVESALALGNQDDDDDDNNNMGGGPESDSHQGMPQRDSAADELLPPPPATAATQVSTTTAGGKKRVRPVLVAVGAADAARGTAAPTTPPPTKKRKSIDPLQDALAAAEKAAAAAPQSQPEAQNQAKAPAGLSPPRYTQPPDAFHDGSATLVHPLIGLATTGESAALFLSYNKDRLQAVDLPMAVEASQADEATFGATTLKGCVAECTNSLLSGSGNGGEELLQLDIVLRRDGQPSWRDAIPGTHCCAVAASHHFLAVGTVDGTIQLYETSPTMGWKSGQAFRSHPPLVVGCPVVTLRLRDNESTTEHATEDEMNTQMLVVSSNGSFAIYNLMPVLRLHYKGSLLPAMNHMLLSCRTSVRRASGSSFESLRLPELIRVQFAQSGSLLALLGNSTESEASVGGAVREARSPRAGSTSSSTTGVGGSLQAYVYDRSSELWMRVADGRFVLSDLYSSLPSKSKSQLARLDDSVRFGSNYVVLNAAHRQRGDATLRQGDSDTQRFLATRSHCEDRMACAFFLQSKSDFKHWLVSYIRTLAQAGDAESLRVLTDAVMQVKVTQNLGDGHSSHWWLTRAFHLLGLERGALVKSIILPELRKNLALQRLTNEIALEVP